MPDLSAILLHFSPELILVIGALAILVFDLALRGREARQEWLAVLTLVLALAATFYLYSQPPATIFEARGAGGEVVRAGAFASDYFTQFFRVVSLLTTLLVLLSSITYLRPRSPFRGEFYTLLLLAATAMNLMAGANDLIMVALAVEFLSITSYILTGFLRGDRLSGEAGLKYFLYGSITSAAMLYGLVLIYGATGTTSLPAVAAVVSSPREILVSRMDSLLLPALMLVLAGLGFKIALVPFHQWSPDAYHGAPTPVTSFLSIGPKAAGFALLTRFLMTVFATPPFPATWIGTLTAMAILTMIVGNLVALSQRNVKRMMAYSSISQAGYMLVGVVSVGVASAAMRQAALGSLLIFILAYLFTNAGAFAAIIAVDHASGSSDLDAYKGLMHRSPLLAISLVVFFLSLIGIPPMAGFIGKFSVFKAALAADQVVLAIVGVLTGVISVAYYLGVVRRMFFAPADKNLTPIAPSGSLTFVLVACLVMTLVIGLYAAPFLQLANDAVTGLVPAGSAAQEALVAP